MITPDFLNNVIRDVESKTYDMNTRIIKRVSKKVADSLLQFEDVELPLTLLIFQKNLDSENTYNDIQAIVKSETKNISKEVKKAFLRSASEVSDHNTQIAKDIAKGTDIKVPDYDKIDNPTRASQLNLTDAEVKEFEDAYKRASRIVSNYTRTMPSAGQRAYINACNSAYLDVKNGTSLNDAIIRAIEEMSRQGITVVNYDSGKTDKVEVAIARAVRTGINQLNSKIVLTRCASMGLNTVRVSAHLGARVSKNGGYESHVDWQGKVYSLDWNKPILKKLRPELDKKGKFAWLLDIADYVKVIFTKKYPDFVECTGYGEMLGLAGINCRHSFWAFNPKNDDDAPIEIDQKENQKQYEAEQKARAMERAIREDKRKIDCLEGSGLKGDEVENEKNRLKNLLEKHEARYNNYIESIEKDFKVPKSVGAMAKKFYIKTNKKLRDSELYLKAGTNVTGVKVIAQGEQIRDIKRLIQIGRDMGIETSVKDWYKMRGRGIVTNGVVEESREIHWYQAPNVGKIDFKYPSNEKQR